MRWTLISFLCIVAISNVMGQKHVFTNKIEGQSPIHIGLEEVKKSFTPPSAGLKLKSGSVAQSRFIVNYVNFPDEAKNAFEHAVDLWEQNLSSPIPITVVAKWENLGSNTLALCRPSTFFKNFDAAPVADVYYPVALAEKLAGKEWNGSKEADLICTFSASASWYFGTDGNTPVTSYDFVTAVLHEIAHGLGISGFLEDKSGMGQIANSSNNPSIYDYYIFNSLNQRITDHSIFNSPSAELHHQLTSDNLDFGCDMHGTCSRRSDVYAPNTWRIGMSIYHLENNEYQDHNELMSPFLYKGEANHDPAGNTLKVLEGMGWNAGTVQISELKDLEASANKITVETKVNSSVSLIDSTFKIVFSTDNFTTTDTAGLSYNDSTGLYQTNLEINGYKGKVYYYYTVKTVDNNTFTFPNQAPAKKLNFKIGTDYYSPLLSHNPSKMISSSRPEFQFKAHASDNLGISSVKIEYRINGMEQEPFLLDQASEEGLYTGRLEIPGELSQNDNIEYRIIATDKSSRINKKFLPSQGYYEVSVFDIKEPVSGYHSDFNSNEDGFTFSDFSVDVPAGFFDGNLHTRQPYPVSEMNGDKYDLVALLNHPIILEENGMMTFDEVVLVEPGQPGTEFTDDLFWDYVIVEASNDYGKNWHAMVDGYDSGVNDMWQSRFNETLKSSSSSAAGAENMFWKQTINLTDNNNFSAGDTVLFRFRLSSDNTVNGWGWAIDNLKIQNLTTDANITAAGSDVNVYPNPCTNNLIIDCIEMNNTSSVEINITDLYGKTVYRETKYDIQFDPKLKIDLTNVSTGMYLANITDSELNTYTHKIIKN